MSELNKTGRLLAFTLIGLLTACDREPAPQPPAPAVADKDIPPMQPRPDNLGPSVKWPAESPRYQQIRREAYREGVDFENTVKEERDLRSRQERYRVSVLDAPAKHRILHDTTWLVRVTTPDGKPVSGASIHVMGGMPEHGHGLPSQPAVSSAERPGEYRITGLNFNMAGWWEVSLYIAHEKRDDSVTFNLIAN